MIDWTTPQIVLAELKFEPFDSFAIPPYAHYLTDERFREDVCSNSVELPVADFMPDIMQQESSHFVLPDEYTVADAYRDLVLATRFAIQAASLSGGGIEDANANAVGNFWFRASVLLAKSQGASMWTPNHLAHYVELYKQLPKLQAPRFDDKIIHYLKNTFQNVEELTHVCNEDVLSEFAFDVWQSRVTEPPRVETFNATDARKTAVAALYYYARTGELYKPDIQAALEVLLQCAFHAR